MKKKMFWGVLYCLMNHIFFTLSIHLIQKRLSSELLHCVLRIVYMIDIVMISYDKLFFGFSERQNNTL